MTAGPPAYALSIRILHWLTAVLVAGLFGLAVGYGLVAEAMPDLGDMLVDVHIHVGFFVFLATLLRLVFRIGMPSPRPFPETRKPLSVLARTTHGLLYAGLLTIPVAGYVKLAALGYEIRLFGTVPLPGLPFDPALARVARDLHANAALCLAALITVHGAAAVLHRRIDGASVMHRMALWPRAPGVNVVGKADRALRRQASSGRRRFQACIRNSRP